MNILEMIEYSNWELGSNQVVVECDKGLDIHIGCDIISRRKEIKGLIDHYRDLFVRKGSQLGCANVETHKIWTVDEVPVAQPYRRVVPTEVGPVKMQIEEWCRDGVIVKSKSAYASPLVVVQKSNGDLRLCVDYRKLNAKTVRDAYPIPRVDDSLESLEGAKILSCFDLKSAYTQVRLDVKHQNGIKRHLVRHGAYMNSLGCHSVWLTHPRLSKESCLIYLGRRYLSLWCAT